MSTGESCFLILPGLSSSALPSFWPGRAVRAALHRQPTLSGAMVSCYGASAEVGCRLCCTVQHVTSLREAIGHRLRWTIHLFVVSGGHVAQPKDSMWPGLPTMKRRNAVDVKAQHRNWTQVILWVWPLPNPRDLRLVRPRQRGNPEYDPRTGKKPWTQDCLKIRISRVRG